MKEICKQDGCNKSQISFSDYCGEHTDSADYTKKLQNLTEGEYSNVVFDEVEPEGVVFRNMIFRDIQLIETVFEDCQFLDCHFDAFNLEWGENVFTNCEFIECRFEGIHSRMMTFESCQIQASSFFACDFSSTAFLDDCRIENTVLHGCNWTEVNFYRCLLFSVEFQECRLIDLAIQYCSADNLKISRSVLKGHLLIVWSNILNSELDLSGTNLEESLVEFCDFNGTNLIHEKLPETFAIWNNFNEEYHCDFLEKLVPKMIAKQQDVDFDELVDMLQYLGDHGHPISASLRSEIESYYKAQYFLSKEHLDFERMGNVLRAISKFQEFLYQNNFALIPLMSETRDGAIAPSEPPKGMRLKVSFWFPSLTFGRLNRFTSLFRQIEKAFDPSGIEHFEITGLTKGTLTTELYKDGRDLLLTGEFLETERLKSEKEFKELLAIEKRQQIEHQGKKNELELEILEWVFPRSSG